MDDNRPPTHRRRVVIGYLASTCVFLILNALYWLLVENGKLLANLWGQAGIRY